MPGHVARTAQRMVKILNYSNVGTLLLNNAIQHYVQNIFYRNGAKMFSLSIRMLLQMPHHIKCLLFIHFKQSRKEKDSNSNDERFQVSLLTGFFILSRDEITANLNGWE